MLETIKAVLWSEGSIGGALGAFLVTAASYFVKVGWNLRRRPFHLKLLFAIGGAVLGGIVHAAWNWSIWPCAVCGAGWPWAVDAVARTAQRSCDIYRTYGPELRKAVTRFLLRSMADETDADDGETR